MSPATALSTQSPLAALLLEHMSPATATTRQAGPSRGHSTVTGVVPTAWLADIVPAVRATPDPDTAARPRERGRDEPAVSVVRRQQSVRETEQPCQRFEQ